MIINYGKGWAQNQRGWTRRSSESIFGQNSEFKTVYYIKSSLAIRPEQGWSPQTQGDRTASEMFGNDVDRSSGTSKVKAYDYSQV